MRASQNLWGIWQFEDRWNQMEENKILAHRLLLTSKIRPWRRRYETSSKKTQEKVKKGRLMRSWNLQRNFHSSPFICCESAELKNACDIKEQGWSNSDESRVYGRQGQSKTYTKQYERVQEVFFYSHLLQLGREPSLSSCWSKRQEGFLRAGIRGSEAICACSSALPKEKGNFLISSWQKLILQLKARHSLKLASIYEDFFYLKSPMTCPLTEDREVEVPSLMMTFQRNESQIQKVISGF